MIDEKCDYASKTIYFPNRSEDILAMNQEYDIPVLPDGFKIMIAGNLGKVPNLDAVGEAMKEFKDTKQKWLIVDNGKPDYIYSLKNDIET